MVVVDDDEGTMKNNKGTVKGHQRSDRGTIKGRYRNKRHHFIIGNEIMVSDWLFVSNLMICWSYDCCFVVLWFYQSVVLLCMIPSCVYDPELWGSSPQPQKTQSKQGEGAIWEKFRNPLCSHLFELGNR
jgi:hypothetical protein